VSVKIIAEIGINHNGSIEDAKKLITFADLAGCDYVKFQKRTPDVCVPEHQKQKIREGTPWGDISYIDYKHKVEFEKEEYDALFEHCKDLNVELFASVWDLPSVDFMANYTNIGKIPSALITDLELVAYARHKFEFLIVSTGMSTEEEIEAVMELEPDVVMHTNSTYPSKVEELNLNYIYHLREKYPDTPVGYSGHEFGLVTTMATVPMGVKWIERHITLDRTMWGSDQMCSIEPHGLIKLVRGIREVESAMGLKGERHLYESELSKRKSLRGV
jgi:N-acetylneuraminate synthase